MFYIHVSIIVIYRERFSVFFFFCSGNIYYVFINFAAALYRLDYCVLQGGCVRVLPPPTTKAYTIK